MAVGTTAALLAAGVVPESLPPPPQAATSAAHARQANEALSRFGRALIWVVIGKKYTL